MSASQRLHLARIRLKDGFRACQAEADRRLGAPHLAKIFERQLGYALDLENPRTFNEKIQWRKLFDRRPEYPVVSDKLRLREWAAGRLGPRGEGLFVELHAATDRPRQIDFSALPPDLALKANHGSGWNLFLRREDRVDHEQVVRTCEEWLAQKFNRRKHEWAYWPIPPMIVVEELVRTASGAAPDDLKLFMFDGVCRIVQHDQSRFSEAHRRAYMAPDWTDAGFAYGKLRKADPPPCPERWADILGIAETLSRGFDFVRVDFLLFDGRHALNEMTLYSGGGLKPFHPREIDHELGTFWRLPGGVSDG